MQNVWKDMRVSKCVTAFLFWVNFPFNTQRGKCPLPRGNECVHHTHIAHSSSLHLMVY